MMKNTLLTLMVLVTVLLVSQRTFAVSATAYHGGSYDGYAMATSSEGPLPVTLTSFTAIGYDGHCLIHWETASEIDFLGFNLQRGLYQDTGYAQINESLIYGRGSPVDGADYSYIDSLVTNGLTYWYRLEILDKGGKGRFFEPDSAIPGEKRLEMRVYPNPFSQRTVISYWLPVIGKNLKLITDYRLPITLSIYDLSGRLVRTLVDKELTPGIYKTDWNGLDNDNKAVRQGSYFCVLRVDGKTINKVVVVK